MRGLGRHERPFGSATPGTGPGGQIDIVPTPSRGARRSARSRARRHGRRGRQSRGSRPQRTADARDSRATDTLGRSRDRAVGCVARRRYARRVSRDPGLTVSTGHGASNSTRCALAPRMSLPTGLRRRRPSTTSWALTCSAVRIRSSATSPPLQQPHLVVDARGRELGPDPVELRLEGAALLLRSVGTCAHDDHDARVALPCLLDRRPEGRPTFRSGQIADHDAHRSSPRPAATAPCTVTLPEATGRDDLTDADLPAGQSPCRTHPGGIAAASASSQRAARQVVVGVRVERPVQQHGAPGRRHRATTRAAPAGSAPAPAPRSCPVPRRPRGRPRAPPWHGSGGTTPRLGSRIRAIAPPSAASSSGVDGTVRTQRSGRSPVPGDQRDQHAVAHAAVGETCLDAPPRAHRRVPARLPRRS